MLHNVHITIVELWWAAMCTRGVIRLQALHGQIIFVIHCACRHWSLGKIRGTFLLSWTMCENDTKTFLHLKKLPLSWNLKPEVDRFWLYAKGLWPSAPAVGNLSIPKGLLALLVYKSRLLTSEKFHRRDLNMRPTDPEGGTQSTQPLSHRVSTVLWVPCP